MSSVQLNKLVFTIGDKTIELSTEEAKSLRDVLNDIMGDAPEKEIVYIPTVFEPKPYSYKTYPCWIYTPNIGTGTITISDGNYSGNTFTIPNNNNITPTL